MNVPLLRNVIILNNSIVKMNKLVKLAGICALGATMLIGCSSEKGQSNSENTKVTAQENTSEANKVYAGMDFEEKSYDFGEITQGDKVEHVFKFKNTGDTDLIIKNVKTSCGCTAPEWPKEPIAAGETSEIKVVFNSRGKNGNQSKNIMIYANVPDGLTSVKITAKVNVPEKEEATM